jgi:hypothetical protein
MCDATSENIGNRVPDDVVIYRACTKSICLSPSKDSIEAPTFQKDGKNHTDGLSCTTTPEASIAEVGSHGIARIRVGDIHQMGRGLEVRYDITDPVHVLIRNMPCMDREDAERGLAEAVASELAIRAVVESTARTKRPFVPPLPLPSA